MGLTKKSHKIRMVAVRSYLSGGVFETRIEIYICDAYRNFRFVKEHHKVLVYKGRTIPGTGGDIGGTVPQQYIDKLAIVSLQIVMCGGPAMIISCLYSLRSLNYPSDFIFIYGQFGTEQVKTVYGRNVKLSTHRCHNVL